MRDADAQLILSKENTAARLLSRPGEAIYNDQNGLVEGNNLFQVVWLDDDQQDKVLADIRKRADTDGPGGLGAARVRGERPGGHREERRRSRSCSTPRRGRRTSGPGTAWLGDAVAIKDPTAAMFRPVGGHNLLMVGQQDEAALSIDVVGPGQPGGPVPAGRCSSSSSWTARRTTTRTPASWPASRTCCRIGADDRPDRPGRGARRRWPSEVTARQKNESPDRTPCFVFVHGAQRFRELRKEDDFGFGRRGAERAVPPAEHLAAILRDGPTVGVHVVLWADTPTNLGRVVDRAGMREFGLRVLFQMGVNDSSALIDSPAASRLGRNRALFVTEETSQPEKFRPYGLPSKAVAGDGPERLKAKGG